MESLRGATARDGVVVPDLVRQIRAAVGEPHGRHAHFGATSQDVVDTSLALRLRSVLALLRVRIEAIGQALHTLDETHGANALIGRTRMQAALPMTVSDRVRAWRRPLERRLGDLGPVEAAATVLSFSGPVGTLDKLGDKGPAVRLQLSELLDLNLDDASWHSQRDRFAALANWFSLVTGNLGKLGQDVALMAQNGIDEIVLSGGGGSSAMAHKHNPVAAELLVTLARFNAAQLSAMHQSLVHEQERSGAAWSLEWMVLPQMAIAAGAALRTASGLVAAIQRIGSPTA